MPNEQLSSEHGVDATVPVLLPPPEQRIATAADVMHAKDEMRREMKLWLLAGGAVGQGFAAATALVLSGRAGTSEQFEAAYAVLISLF